VSSVSVHRHDDKVVIDVAIGHDAIHAETYDDGVAFVLREDEAKRLADLLFDAAIDILSTNPKDSVLPVETMEFQS